MLRQVPPLSALEAFLAATQARSFRAAAETLALSPSAFSRRIQMLEQFVGAEMFDRRMAGTPLTPAGEQYLGEVASALELIRQATASLQKTGERRVRVATSHSFAAEWLIPRLPALAKVHDIEVVLTISRDPNLLRTGAVEVAIRGEALDRLEDGEIITPVDVVAVSAPRLADGRPPPRTIEEVASARLLGVRGQMAMWRTFLGGAESPVREPQVATYDTNQLTYEAAVSGLGIALAAPLVSDRFLGDGRLVGCIPLRRQTGWGYVLRRAAPGARSRPATRDFVAWLKLEADKSLQTFDHWYAAIAPDAPLTLAR